MNLGNWRYQLGKFSGWGRGMFLLLGWFVATACAEDITYEFINYPELQSGCRMAGTITTDGTLGPLQATNIKTWSMELFRADGTRVDRLSKGTRTYGSLPPGIATFEGISATESKLEMASGAGDFSVFFDAETTSFNGDRTVNSYFLFNKGSGLVSIFVASLNDGWGFGRSGDRPNSRPWTGSAKIPIAGRVISDAFDGLTIDTNRWSYLPGVTAENASLAQMNGALRFQWTKWTEGLRWSQPLPGDSSWTVLVKANVDVEPGYTATPSISFWPLTIAQMSAILTVQSPASGGGLSQERFVSAPSLNFGLRQPWQEGSGPYFWSSYNYLSTGVEGMVQPLQSSIWLMVVFDAEKRTLRQMVSPANDTQIPSFSSFLPVGDTSTNVQGSSFEVFLAFHNDDWRNDFGSHTLQNYGTSGFQNFTILPRAIPEPPVISSPATASGAVNGSFSYQITASGYPTSFSASGLPDGLSVDGATGLIYGTPTSAGTNAITVRATNEGGTGEKTVTITIRPVPVFAGPNYFRATIGRAFNHQLLINDFLSVRAANLPPGITLSTSGVLSGTPTTAGIFRPVLTATNTNGASTFQPNFVVQAASPTLPFTDPLATNTLGRYLKISGGTADLTFEAGRLNYSAPANPNGAGDANRVFFSPNVQLPLDSSWEVSVDVGLPRDREAIDNAVGLALIPDQGTEDLSGLPANWISMELGQDFQSSQPFGGETSSSNLSFNFVYNADPNSFPWDSCNSQGIYGWKSDYFQPGAALFFNDALPWERFWDMVLTSIYLDDQILNPAVFCNAARVGTLVGVALTNTTDGPGFFSNGPYRTINNGGIIVASGKLRPGRFNLYTFFNYSGLIGRRAEGQIFRSTEITPEKISTLRLRYSSVSKTLVSDFNSAKASSWTNWAGIQTNSLDPAVADSLGQKFSLNGQSALRLGLWANARTPEAYPTNRIWFSNLVVRSLPGPTLTALPASRTLTAGSALELNAPTGEGTFQYQWQKNRHDIEGATNATFTIESVTAADAGSYTVRVSDDVASTTSSPCALSVLDGPQLTLVYPGARSTYVAGLFGTNTVGFYDGYPDDEGNVERHGFLYNGSNWTQLRPTNSLRSEARGISSNRIVGTFTDSNERRRGYLLQNGVYTLLDYPGSTETRAFGVDGDRIVGEYRDTNSVRRAFLRTGTSWTNFSFPGAVSTSARGISGNRIVGNYTDLSGGAKGFILEGTNWTSLSHTNLIPSSEDPAQAWYATSISANGVSGNTVTGELNGAGGTASFLYQGGAWQILSPSNLPVMIAYGIQGNRLGGFYLESPESGNWLGTVLTLPAPEITTFEPINATMGDPFTLSVTADNAPAGFTATNLPPGLSLNPTNGMISGTPSWSGEYLAMISASNSAGVGSKNINFYVESQQLRIPSQGSFSKQLSAPGGAARFQVSGLPSGLTLSSSGLISGTPASAGYYPVTFRVSNATGVFTSQIGFTVFRSNLVVTGRVVTPSNTPVANFPLRLVNPAFSGKIFASATTAANGTFQLTAPADRNYQIVQANLTNVNTLPTRFLYPVHVFNDWFGTPVDAGDIQAVAVDRTLQVRMVDAFSGEPITGTNLTRMGAAALSCEFIPLADPVAIWMLHQIQIRAQKSFWKLTAEERAGLRDEASRLWTATRDNPSAGNADEVEIDWSFLEGYQTKELPPTYYANMQYNWNAQDTVVFYQEAEIFRYFAKTNSAGLYEVPVAVLGNDPRVNPWYMSDVAGPNPNCCMELAFDASEAVRGKVIARYEMVYEKGFFGQPGYRANNPLAVDLKVRPAPRMISGNFYRSNGTTPVTNGWVFLSQDIDHPSQDFLSTKCKVGAAGQFQFAVPEDSQDDWVITGEELSDTLTTAGGENWFTLARQFLQIRSSDVTGLKLVADQAPAIVSIQNGRAGESFRVTGSNLACLGSVTLIPQASSEEEVVVQPVFQELWTARRETGFVEFGVPDYLPPGSYKIQYRHPNFAANLVPFDLLSGGYDNEGFTTVTASNIFSISAGTNTNSFSGRAGEVIRLPIRFGEKRMWNVTLSNNITGEALMLQPRSITPQYVELQLPQDAVLGEWSVVWGDALPIASLTLDDPTPVISLDPVNQNVAEGGTANFAVSATGAQPLRYQWTQNGLNVDGATNSTLTITNARSIHAGEYAAVVSNWVGSVTSAVATLSVQQRPRILTQPRGTNLIAGQTYTLAVSAEGTEPMAYQWRKGGTNLEGANASSLLLDPVAGSDAGTYSVLVSNAVGSVLSSNTVLTVLSPPQFAVQATSGLRATLASAFRYDPIVTGSAAVFSLSNAPAGLFVNRANGSVTGKPTTSGYYRATLTASNAAGTASLPLNFTVPGSQLRIPFSDNFSVAVANRYLPFNVYSPASLSVRNGVASFDSPADGDNGATAGFVLNLPLPLASSWDIAADVNLPNGWETTEAEIGLSLESIFGPSDTVETHSIRGNYLNLMLNRDTEPSEEGANNVRRNVYVGNVGLEDLQEVLVDDSFVTARLRLVYLSGNKTLTAWVQTDSNTGWVRLGSPLDFNPGNANSLAQKWSLSSGSSLMLVLYGFAEGGTGGRTISLDNLSITTPVAPVITSTRNLNGQVGTPFSYQISAANNPISYGAINLPAGVELNSTTGVISGTPSAAGVISTVVLSAVNPAGTGTRTNTAVILPAFTGASSVTGFVNDSAFTHPVTVGTHNFGANLKFSATGLPTGMTINTTSGMISGKPTVARAFPATVTVTALGASASQRIDFTIQGAAGGVFSLTLNPRPTNVLNLPAGLSYNKTTGVISGTPRGWGNFTATGQMSNGTTSNISIPVMPSVPVIGGPTNWNAQVGQETRYQIVAGGFGREWAGWDDFSSGTTKWRKTPADMVNLDLWPTVSSLAVANGELNYQCKRDDRAYWTYLLWNQDLPLYANWAALAKIKISGAVTQSSLGSSVRAGFRLAKIEKPASNYIEGNLNQSSGLNNAGSSSPQSPSSSSSQPRSAEEEAFLAFYHNASDRTFSYHASIPTLGSELQELETYLDSSFGLGSANVVRLGIGGLAEGSLVTSGQITFDDFFLLPDPDDIEYRAYLVNSSGVALTNGQGERYLPDGLECDPQTGSVIGTVSSGVAAGVYQIRTEAEYLTANLPIQGLPTVKGGKTVPLTLLPAFTGASSATGFLNVAGFTHQVAVGTHSFDSNLKFSATGLPTGTTINTTSGLISGKPTVAGTFGTRVTITAGTATAFQNIQISVYNGDGNRWAVGSPVSYQVNLGTGVTGFQASGLPTGMTINATTGLISGTPKEAGEYSVTVTVPARGLSTVIPFFIRPIYVNPLASGLNNGSSWANAYTDLQTAINAAGTGAQIWVKAGTYKPTSYLDPNVTNDARSRSFLLKGGVSVLGGFAGTETQLDQRDVESNPTILSGDFGGNDSATWPPVVGNDGNVGSGDFTRSENAYHVVGALSQTTAPILDGFTITGGNANNTSYRQPNNRFPIPAGIPLHMSASALALVNSDFVLRNSHITKNVGKSASAGFYNLTGALRQVRISDSVFEENLCYYGDGAAINAQTSSTQSVTARPLMKVNVVRSVFVDNESRTGPDQDDDRYPDGGDGGAVYFYWGVEGNFANCVFIHNYANGKKTDGTPWYDGSSGGTEGNGGAILVRDYCRLALANCVFVGNKCDDTGGAINIESGSSLKMYFSTFYENDSSGNPREFGAGVVSGWYGSSSRIANTLAGYGVIAWQNYPTSQEVDLWFGNGSSPAKSTLSQSTFTTSTSIQNNIGSISVGNPNLFNAASPAGPDGLYLTGDDGLRIRSGSIAQNLVYARPADFADLDGDGNTTELLPYDAAGVAYPSNPPYNAGAYQTVEP